MTDEAEIVAERKNQIVEVVASYHRDHGYAPTLRDIRDLLGLQSVGYTHKLVSELLSAGRLVQGAKGLPRTLRVNDDGNSPSEQGAP